MNEKIEAMMQKLSQQKAGAGTHRKDGEVADELGQ